MVFPTKLQGTSNLILKEGVRPSSKLPHIFLRNRKAHKGERRKWSEGNVNFNVPARLFQNPRSASLSPLAVLFRGNTLHHQSICRPGSHILPLRQFRKYIERPMIKIDLRLTSY